MLHSKFIFLILLIPLNITFNEIMFIFLIPLNIIGVDDVYEEILISSISKNFDEWRS